ncbi:MAG: tyrosine-type recombinase/integrase [Micavibrio sp.]
MPKKALGLTDKDILAAKPREKDYKLYDREGLCLLVRKSGTKVWHYNYIYKDRRKTYTIGPYIQKDVPGHVGLKDARMARYEVRMLLAQGIDPSAHKKSQIQSPGDQSTTFESLGREWHSKGTWVSKHSSNILRSLEDDVFPFLGNKQVTDVSRQDIIAVLTNVQARGAYDVAQRICQRCVGIFDYAIVKGVCEDNPALGRAKFIKKPKAKNRPFLKEDELPEFLNKLSSYHGRDYVRIAMQLLVLTFVRPGELRNARWDDVNEDKAVLKIPAERMKMDRDHVVPLSPQAMALLSELRKITGNHDLLFPSIKNNQKPISDVTLTKVLIIMGYIGERKVVPHGFRHTASTILNEHGFNRDHIERQLAHVEINKVRGVYNHAEYLAERRRMMDWYAEHLEKLMEKYDAEKVWSTQKTI